MYPLTVFESLHGCCFIYFFPLLGINLIFTKNEAYYNKTILVVHA